MFNCLRIYTVHVRPEDSVLRARPVFVKEGFNIPAFLLTALWALYHRLWLPALGMGAAQVALFALAQQQVFSPAAITAVDLGVHLLFGFHANDWRRARLRREGYIFADVTAADSLLRAEQRYFERALAAAG